jgi:hypothetical protein
MTQRKKAGLKIKEVSGIQSTGFWVIKDHPWKEGY